MHHNCILTKKLSSQSSIHSHMISNMYQSVTAICGGALSSALKEITRSTDKSHSGPLSADRMHKAISGQTSYSTNFRGVDVIATAVNENESSGKGKSFVIYLL